MSSFTHLVVLDFEATCDDEEPPDPQEIIEFPSVLLKLDGLEVVSEFESFVRPVHHPVLTRFCTELTSITQDQIENAPTFPEVFAAHQRWLESNGLPLEPDDSGALPYALVTCGDWDLQTMLPGQLRASDPPFDFMPHPYRRWINVKDPFRRWNKKMKRAGMARMLEALDLELIGHHHRGIDDTRNIARLTKALIARHQPMVITGELSASRYPPLTLTLERWGERVEVELAKRAMGTLLGLASGTFHKQAKQVFEGDRELTEDAHLRELRNGAVLRIA
ncbi:MAG: exonuclease domain-containing protein [Deltaproteobacteria bacterium]|nr:exonuclease domain-containing protein [Deltaproteobacteria bacterium]